MKREIFFKPYAAILFLPKRAGVLLFLLSFYLPSVGILGFVAIISTIIFAHFTSTKEEYLKNGFYLYNSLLVGMGIGYFYDVSLVTVFLSAFFAIFTYLLSFFLNKVFSMFYLPILSLPFGIVSIIFYLSSYKYHELFSNLVNRNLVFDINFDIFNFFKSFGTIFFLPYSVAGILMFLLVLVYSRILAFLGVIGFLVGIFIHSLIVGKLTLGFFDFNFILIAMALGGVFLIPYWKNYLMALIGVILSVFLIDAFEVFGNLYNLPVYTLPFNIIVILFVMLLGSLGYKYFNYSIKETPEKSLHEFLSNFFRFKTSEIKIHLPFSGKWSVYQAFDGKYTHKGKWKYAYDFVKVKNGKMYEGEGNFLEDYYAFGESVLSPVNGYVVAMRHDLPDNPIGIVDRENNWGNYIIIKSDYGYFVEISHLMQYSIPVKIGDYVKVGDIIGKCGNSGYSPMPHIHIQVQKYAVLGSETLPFLFEEYIKDKKLYYYSLPKENEEIEATILDKGMKNRVSFILDEVYKYKSDDEEIKFVVKMNSRGEFYFCDGENKLFFYLKEKMFYFYGYEGKNSFLKELFKIVPRIPLINKEVEYSDFVPLDVKLNGLKRYLVEFLLPFDFKRFFKEDFYKKEKLKVSCKYGEVGFSFYHKGFSYVKIGEKIYRRFDEEVC